MKTKKVLLMLAVFLGLASSVKAQQLTVEYLVKANVNSPSFMAGAGLPDEVRSMYANAMKDFEMKFVLRYNDGESEFANVPMDKPQSVTIMGQTIDGKTLEEQYKGNITYKNRKKNVFVQRNNFMGKVVDMLYFPIIDTTWPAWVPFVGGDHFIFFSPVFNFADSCITVGVILMLICCRRDLELMGETVRRGLHLKKKNDKKED